MARHLLPTLIAMQIAEQENHAMSKRFQCLSMMAIIGIVTGGLSPATSAGNLPARGGKTDYPVSEPQCWGLRGGTIQNICNQAKSWYMPMVNVGAGRFWVIVTAETNTLGLQCISTGANHEGTSWTSSGLSMVPPVGSAIDIWLDTTVPSGGSAMVDCYVPPGGKLHTLSW